MSIGRSFAVETTQGIRRVIESGVGRRLALVAVFAALAGCGSAQTSGAAVPSAGRPMWSQCSTSVTAWCHRQGQGDPTLDRDCEASTTRESSALADDSVRRQYLTAHGCSL